MGVSRHMRCSGGCGLSWLCSADTEHICDDHTEAVVADGECVPLPCKVQSGLTCLLAPGSAMCDLKVVEQLCLCALERRTYSQADHLSWLFQSGHIPIIILYFIVRKQVICFTYTAALSFMCLPLKRPEWGAVFGDGVIA